MQTTNKSWYKRWWGIIIILFLSFVIIFFIAFFIYVFNNPKDFNNSNSNNISKNISYYENDEQRLLIEGSDNYWTGSVKPKITIVEFADFNCPYCKNSYSKIREISLNYKDKIKYIYRDLPILENSEYLSMSARCAGEQGLFWLMHDKLFQNKSLDYEKVLNLAIQIGADENKFIKCLNSSKYLNKIKKDISDANSLNINQTPVWFINGYKISGDIPLDIFNKIIEDLLIS